MPDFVNVINKEEITKALDWPSALVGLIAIIVIITTLIVCGYLRNKCSLNVEDILIKIVYCVGIIGIVGILVLEFVCNLHKVPTGRHKYSATFDDTATYEEINDFLNDYTNVSIEEGVYYFEDKSSN